MKENEQIFEMIQRLNNLEKKNNFLRRMNYILIFIVVLIPILGFQISTQFFKVIETEKLILKDKKGKERAVLFMDGDVVKFRLKNSKDSIMCMMGADQSEGYLILNDTNNYQFYFKANYAEIKNDTVRKYGCGINEDNNAYLVLENNELSKNLYSSKKTILNAGIFEIKQEKTRSLLEPGKLFLRDDEGIERIVIESMNSIHPGNVASIVLRNNVQKNKDGSTPSEWGYGIGNTRLQLWNDGKDIGISLFDKNGNIRTAIGNTTTTDKNSRKIYNPESSIYLFDENGNGLFQAPQ